MTTFYWPIYIAKDADYYKEQGLEAKLTFANHPADVASLASGEADVLLTTLQGAMTLAPKYPSATMIGNPLSKWLLALVAQPRIRDIGSLRGKRIGITHLGGNIHHYAVRLLDLNGVKSTEVTWIPIGSSSRVAALESGQVEATMLSAPSYYTLEKEGFTILANINDEAEIDATNVLLFSKKALAKNPQLPLAVIKAHAQAVKRFYADKLFAVGAYLHYDRQEFRQVEMTYEAYAAAKSLQPIPYISQGAVQYSIGVEPDAQLASAMREFDYSGVVDNQTIDRLVDARFFERLFGPDIAPEQKRQRALAFR